MLKKELYKKIFTLEFLIKYGYFDISVKRDSKKILDNDSNLNENYGKADAFYYKVFNLEDLVDYINKNDLRKHFNLKKTYKNRYSEPVHFTIPKDNVSRRLYKMPNLYNYMLLAFFILDHKDKFEEVFNNNEFSTSKYFNQFDFTFDITQEFRKQLLYGGRKILNIDLSNFYHSLYTHSIPWMINGKNNAKINQKGGFANDLDKCISLCQNNETHGLPTGNLLTRLIAELYMCYVDEKIKSKGYVYSRYVDDISFSYTLEANREAFYRDFNELCMKYNLTINNKKTTIDEYPFSEKNDKSDLFSFFSFLKITSKEETWVKKIRQFIDYSVSEESEGNKGAIKSLFSVIINALKSKKIPSKKVELIFAGYNSITNYNLLINILDLSLKDSRLTNKFLSFTHELEILGMKKEKINNVIDSHLKSERKRLEELLDFYHSNNYNQEFYQILLYLVEFNASKVLSHKKCLQYLNSDTDDFSLVLLTIIYLKNNWSKQTLLREMDRVLIDMHASYGRDSIRFSEKLWYFRYFIYSLQVEGILSKVDVNTYANGKGYRLDQNKGYQTELNWKYIKSEEKHSNLNEFYDELLNNKIYFVNMDIIV